MNKQDNSKVLETIMNEVSNNPDSYVSTMLKNSNNLFRLDFMKGEKDEVCNRFTRKDHKLL